MVEVWAIVLAAGESVRMGTPKMLLPFHGSTILEKVIENISKSTISKIMVVTGADSETIIRQIRNLNVSYCYNEKYSEGMLSSVICGFRNVPPETSAIAVFQGDQPLIKHETINIVITAYDKSDRGLIIPVFENRRGHPFLIDKKYRKEIEKLNPDEGLRSLSSIFKEDVLEVETNDQGILKDIDTYEEYMNLK